LGHWRRIANWPTARPELPEGARSGISPASQRHLESSPLSRPLPPTFESDRSAQVVHRHHRCPWQVP
jgi:hypothetical protein